jgi:hypothetical protein
MRITRKLLAFAAVSSAAVAACQLLVGAEDVAGVARPADAGDAAVVPPGTCVGARPPDPQDGGTGKGPPLYFAAKELVTLRDGLPVGYNVDALCTAGGVGMPCAGSPDDLDGGLDNAFVSFLAGIAINEDASDPLTPNANGQIDAGREGIFFGLYFYNGGADDDAVELGIVPSSGLAAVGCGDAAVEAGSLQGPRWDGCDVWTLEDKLPSNNLTRTQHGYVTGHTLVVPYDDTTFQVGVFAMHLHHAVVTAKIVPFDGGVALVDGVVAGQIRTSDLIEGARELRLNVNGKATPLCDIGLDDELRSAVCASRDLRVEANDPGAECDGLSVGFGFEAWPSSFGVRGDDPPAPSCAPTDASCN